jgi:hypothetical protein
VECERREADRLTAVREKSGDHIQSILAENSFKAMARSGTCKGKLPLERA